MSSKSGKQNKKKTRSGSVKEETENWNTLKQNLDVPESKTETILEEEPTNTNTATAESTQENGAPLTDTPAPSTDTATSAAPEIEVQKAAQDDSTQVHEQPQEPTSEVTNSHISDIDTHQTSGHVNGNTDLEREIYELKQQVQLLTQTVHLMQDALQHHGISLDYSKDQENQKHVRNPNLVTVIEDEVVYSPAPAVSSDQAKPVREHAFMSQESVVHAKTIHVEVGPGAVGVRMTPNLEVAELLALPNNRPSQLEGQVPLGAALIMFDGRDASDLTEATFRDLVRRTSHKNRTLSFRIEKRVDGERLEAFKRAFAAVDQDANGVLTFDELKQAMTKAGRAPSDDEIRNMIRSADLNDDGEVDFGEFVRIMDQ